MSAREYRAGRRAAYDLTRQSGVRRRTVRRIIRESQPVQDWAVVRRCIARAAEAGEQNHAPGGEQ